MNEVLLHLNLEQNKDFNISVALPKQKTNPFNFLPYLIIGDVDYEDFNIPESNTLSYVCWYLYNKCLKNNLWWKYQVNKSFLLCYFKGYEDKNKTIFGKLQMPHNDFYNLLLNLKIYL